MTKDELILEALDKVVLHWQRLAAAETFDEIVEEGTGPNKCALCSLYFGYPSPCIDCPIQMRVGVNGCRNTPYTEVMAQRNLLEAAWNNDMEQYEKIKPKLWPILKHAIDKELVFVEETREEWIQKN